MTKKEIVQQMVTRTDLTTSQATHALEAVIDILADAITNDEPVYIRGFATIKTVQRAPKMARVIKTGKVINLPTRWQVKFTAYDQLQQRINSAHPIEP